MNNKELIDKYEDKLKDVQFKFGANFKTKVYEELLDDLKQLDEPEPIKLRDVIARIKQLDIGTRKVWLDEILNDLGSDYGTLKYKDGYEQGKFEASTIPYEEPKKPVVPQFVADWIERERKSGGDLEDLFDDIVCEQKHLEWFREEENMNLVARAWLDGYTVEKEKRYRVNVKNVRTRQGTLNRSKGSGAFIFSNPEENNLYGTKFTRTELEEAGFGWVFDCTGVEIEEVE